MDGRDGTSMLYCSPKQRPTSVGGRASTGWLNADPKERYFRLEGEIVARFVETW